VIEPALSDNAFLADVAAARAEVGIVHLWWLGQSGFLVKWLDQDTREGGTRHLLIDPYLSDSLTTKYAKTDKPHVRISRRVVDPARLDFIDVVTSSHNHTDHLDGETLGALLRVNPKIELVTAAANVAFTAERLRIDPDRITSVEVGERIHSYGPAIEAIPSAHDRLDVDEQGRHRYVGFLFDFLNGLAIYHSGDTVVYDDMANILRSHNIDIAILPINGKVGNMNGRDAANLAKDIGAKLVIPCHYDMFEFNTADPNEQFVPECQRLGQPYRVLKLGERFTYPER